MPRMWLKALDVQKGSSQPLSAAGPTAAAEYPHLCVPIALELLPQQPRLNTEGFHTGAGSGC